MAKSLLNNIYQHIQTVFTKKKDALIKAGAEAVPYTSPDDLLIDKLDDAVKSTHELMAESVADSEKASMIATYEDVNFTMAMARDHINADKSRMVACLEYTEYVSKSLEEGDGEDTVDGLFKAKIEKVNL